LYGIPCSKFPQGEIYELAPEDAIFAFEIYCEHVQISNRLKSFFDLRNFLHEFHIYPPEFHHLNEEQNIDIELYIIGLKRGSPKRVRKSSVYGAESTTETKNFEVQTVSNEDTERHEPEKGYKSLQAVSKTWIQTLNSLTALPEASADHTLYKLPKYSIKGKGPFKAPKIKISKPKDKVKEDVVRSATKAATINPITPSLHLLKVPSENDTKKTVCTLTIPVAVDHNATFTNNKTDLESSLEQARMVGNGLCVPRFSPIPSPMARGQCRSLNGLGPEPILGGSFTEHALGMREIPH